MSATQVFSCFFLFLCYNTNMSSTIMLSTLIDRDVKRAAVAYCQRSGLKLRYFLESAILELLEDEIDLQVYNQRKNEETIPLEQILNKVSARKRQ